MPNLSWQQVFVIAVAIAGVTFVMVTRPAEAGAIAIVVQAFMPAIRKGNTQ